MQSNLAGRAELLVDGLANEGPHEDVGLGGAGGHDEVRGKGLVQGVEGVGFGNAGDGFDDLEPERSVEGGRRLQKLVGGSGEAGQAASDNLPNPLRHAQLDQRFAGGPAPVWSFVEGALLGEVAEKLANEERVALGLADPGGPDSLLDLAAAECGQKLRDFCGVEALEGDVLVARLAGHHA